MGDNIRLYFVLAFLFGLLAIGVFLYPGVPETGLGFFIKVLVIISLGIYLWIVLQELQVNVIASSQIRPPGTEPESLENEEEETVVITSVANRRKQPPKQESANAAHFDFSDRDLNATKAYHRFQQLTLDIITETLFCHSAMVYIADVPRNQLVLQDANQSEEGTLVNRVEVGTDLLSQAFTEDKVVLEMMFQPSPDNPIMYYEEPAPPIQSFLAVPIHYHQKVIGVLAVDQSAKESFSREDGHLLKNFAELISSAMVQFDVLDRLTEQRDLYAHLSQVNTKLSLSNSVEDLFQQSILFSRNLFEYDSLVIILHQSQNSEQAEIASPDGDVLNYKEG
ncbi:MAG: GAF domain-containing protein, partial [Calditrichota bacterium]